MDRARRTDAGRARRRRVAGLTLALASIGACHELTLSPDRVIALEISPTAPKVRVGDTLRLVARPLNAAGQLVASARVSWLIVDTKVVAFRLDPSGLVTGDTLGSAKVQAIAVQATDTMRSDAFSVTVTP